MVVPRSASFPKRSSSSASAQWLFGLALMNDTGVSAEPATGAFLATAAARFGQKP